MLISSGAVVERTEQKGGTFFQADGKRGRMDYPSLCWRGKSSRGSEFRRENSLAGQVFRNSSVQPLLRL